MAQLAQLTVAEYTSKFNDQMSQGASAAAEAMEKLAKAATDTEASSRRASSSFAQLEARLDSGARLAQAKARADERLAQEVETVSAAVARGNATQERANQLIELATQRRDVYLAGVRRQIQAEEERNRALLGQAGAANSLAVANDNARRSAGGLGTVMGQAGYQIQDFATQVSMGRNALVAFATQGSQLLGVFGTGGAIAGAVLTVGVLAYQLLAAKDASDELAQSVDRLERAFDRATDFFETTAERAGRLARETRAVIALGFSAESQRLQIDLDRQQKALEALQADRSRLIDANRNLPGFNPDGVLREPLAQRAAEIERLQAALRQVESERERALSAPSGAEREESERALQRSSERVQRIIEDRDRQERSAAERRRREDEAILSRSSQRVQNAVQEESRRREMEARRAAEARDREEIRTLERVDRANRQVTDGIVRYGADAFADMFAANSRGWAGMLETFQATFRRTIARIAAEAIIRPIVAPIVASLGLGGSAEAVVGSGDGLGSLSSLFSLGGGINSLTGGGLASSLGLGGVGSSISGVLGTQLWSGGALSAAEVSLLAGGAPTANAFAAGMGPTIGSLFAPAALGALGGGLVAGLTGGNQVGGSIGGGLGATAGFLVGGPVGALIGGAAGGGLGGLFGPSRRNVDYGVTVSGQNGQLAITGSGQKWAADELRELQQQTSSQIAQINQLLSAAGLTVSGSAMIGTGGNGKAGASLEEAFGRFRVSGGGGRLSDRSFGSLSDLSDAAALIQQLDQFAEAAKGAADPLETVRKQFDGLRATAERLGFGLDEVTKAQERAVEVARNQRDLSRLQTIGGQQTRLIDAINSLAIGAPGTSAQNAFAAQQSIFAQELAAARRGVPGADLSRVTSAASSLSQAADAYLGRGAEGAAFQTQLRSSLTSLGADLDLPAFGGSIERAFARLEPLQDEFEKLRTEVSRLRTELQVARLAS